jgi:hypothetical protein
MSNEHVLNLTKWMEVKRKLSTMNKIDESTLEKINNEKKTLARRPDARNCSGALSSRALSSISWKKVQGAMKKRQS